MTRKQKIAKTKPVILVVDDEDAMREVVRDTLEEFYIVVEAQNGQDALNRICHGKPDLVISDVLMPGMDGFSLLQEVKKEPACRNIPFILITAEESREMRLKILEAGADDYIPKPFDRKELLIRIGNLLKLRRQESELTRLNRELQAKISEQLKDIMRKEKLAHFFPQKLVKWIISSDKGDMITSEKKLLTIFFSDLTGFTELAEKTVPETMQNLLNEYFSAMLSIIEQYDGTLDKFIGDGIMVFFGAPEDMDEKEQAVRAVSMAAAMHQRMKKLTKKWTGMGIRHNIKVRMGIHQDYVLVGNFGSTQLMEYTVIGSGVNLANRLESYCPPEKILVSDPVRKHTENIFKYGKNYSQLFRGFEREVPVAELEP